MICSGLNPAFKPRWTSCIDTVSSPNQENEIILKLKY